MEESRYITSEMMDELRQYIEENFVEDNFIAKNYAKDIFKFDLCEECEDFSVEDTISSLQKEDRSLDDLMDELGESFHDQFFRYIDMSGMTDVEVYKKANIDRKLFSKIRSNPDYHPRKSTVLALAIALHLSLDELIDLLTKAEYALSPSSKTDLIIRFFVEKGIYNIFTINEALDKYGEPVLN